MIRVTFINKKIKKAWMGIFKIMGGNSLDGNFPGGNSPEGSLMGGNFPGGSFPDTVKTIYCLDLKLY